MTRIENINFSDVAYNELKELKPVDRDKVVETLISFQDNPRSFVRLSHPIKGLTGSKVFSLKINHTLRVFFVPQKNNINIIKISQYFDD